MLFLSAELSAPDININLPVTIYTAVPMNFGVIAPPPGWAPQVRSMVTVQFSLVALCTLPAHVRGFASHVFVSLCVQVMPAVNVVVSDMYKY